MKNFDETEIKYLAGLLDADGSLSFKFCKSSSGKTFLYLILALTASDKIDQHGYISSLGERCGSCCKITYDKETFSDATKWNVQARGELNQLLPRLLKHMVIKAKHWLWLYNTYDMYKGIDISLIEDELKEASKFSRKDVGPLKPKIHPTWAWVAGYLDGDGCYTFSNRAIYVGCISHVQDVVGIQLLHKAFGGSIYEPREDNTQLWRRGLGKSDKDFATKFLRKMVRHSRLKKHKIEQMLAFHNQSQRLTDFIPTGKVIV